MRLNRLFVVALPAIVLLYVACHKNDSAAPQTGSTKTNTQLNSMEFFSPENVYVKGITSDTPLDVTKVADLMKQQASQKIEDLADTGGTAGSVTGIYEGYTRTFNCSTNSWSYSFNWKITQNAGYWKFQILSDTGLLTIGSLSQKAAVKIDSTAAIVNPFFPTNGAYYWLTFTINDVPNNSNYCNDTTMTNSIAFAYSYYYGDSTYKAGWGGSHTDSLTASNYIIKPFGVDSVHEINDTSYNLYVQLDSLACTPCHLSSLGVSPTENFYYHLVGSSSAWSYVSVAGTSDSVFTVHVNQSGTYEYYTQGYISPGVLSSGELYYGTISVP